MTKRRKKGEKPRAGNDRSKAAIRPKGKKMGDAELYAGGRTGKEKKNPSKKKKENPPTPKSQGTGPEE